MRKIIFDCDNTFGLLNRDIDDGLTLLYLLGAPIVDLLGVTLTFGNARLTEVAKITQEMKKRFELAFDFYPAGMSDRSAANFLVEQVNRYPNEITILATGALTNLADAQEIDPAFFSKVHEIVLMGGTIEPLLVNQQKVAELNFSSDPIAAKAVLLSQARITVMNGHMTAEAFFSKKEMHEFLLSTANVITPEAQSWLSETLENWIKWNEKVFIFSGFCNWDVTTAVYLERPELFSDEYYFLSNEQPELSKGQMSLSDESKYIVKMPKKLLNISVFNQLVIKRMTAGLKSN
ncbi:nucleoside hydrolase [Enterococcus sp. AZ007]|uniref:nucleoside hydrolase n=1 Tax=Enterococcus sp. AZ007 TaxID=2774839 RepID=UPI003F228DE6